MAESKLRTLSVDFAVQILNLVKALKNQHETIVSNQIGRAGSAFAAPDTISYSYNSRSEVIGAVSNQNSAYNYAYNFDPIGNRLTANLAGTSYNYTTNMLNQYTVVNSNQPTYDDDGNMLTNGSWSYTWNGENRMVQAVNGNTKLQFAYDYMGRRIEKKVFDGDTVVSYKRFVYDNYKQVEELDALNSNSVLKRYSWQPEAVGLNVPLSMTDVAMAKNYAYTLDANKNVSDLTDAQGNVVAHYEYSPFGIHVATGSYTGNPFRFSSEFFDSETGLFYYNYRYYNPKLGRWISKDPLQEKGGINLYNFVLNTPANTFDIKGNEVACMSIVIGVSAWTIISKVAIATSALITTYIITEVAKETIQDYKYKACACVAVGAAYIVTKTRTRTETEHKDPPDPCDAIRAACKAACWEEVQKLKTTNRQPPFRRCVHNCLEAAGCSSL